MATTLYIERTGDQLNFMLFSVGQSGQPTLKKQLTFNRAQRNAAMTWLLDLAECRAAASTDSQITQIGETLFETLIPPELADQIRALEGPLQITTNDPTLPWELLHDGNGFLSRRLPTARSLIIDRTLMKILELPDSGSGIEARALVLAGDLECSQFEADALCQVFDDQSISYDRLDFDLGNFTNFEVIQHLRKHQYTVIHYTGHIGVEEEADDKRMSIATLDEPLTPELIMPFLRGQPLVFLNGCHSDLQITSNMVGPQLELGYSNVQGFAQAFLFGSQRGRAKAVIGSSWLVPQEPKEAAAEFVTTFYRNLAGGTGLSNALEQAKLTVDHLGPMYWAPWVVYGDPADTFFQQSSEASVENEIPQAGGEPSLSNRGASGEQTSVSPDSVNEENALSSIADDARQVLFSAFRTTGNNTLSSLSVLGGLVEQTIEPLHSYLVQTEQLRDVTEYINRRFSEANSSDDHQDGKYSLNYDLVSVFHSANRHAQQSQREVITALDILIGILLSSTSEAYQVLAALGLTERLLNDLQLGAEDPPFQLDNGAKQAFQRAVAMARADRVPFVGTPHLMASVLLEDQFVHQVLKNETDTSVLVTDMRRLVGTYDVHPKQMEALPLRPNLIETLHEAASDAHAQGRLEITCVDIASAILKQSDTSTARYFEAISLDTQVCVRRLGVRIA